jgi:predicted esterase
MRGELVGYVYRYEPSAASPSTLLLLHGTGGDENDLIPLGRALVPDAGLLSPRGKVLEFGAPRFFRRLAEGVFDLDDLARQTDDLATFVTAGAEGHGFDLAQVVAVGFSNGANIAASLLLRRTGLIRAAVLFSPMVPFEPEDRPNLEGTKIFIGSGRVDPIATVGQVERLTQIFQTAGADVSVYWFTGSHTLVQPEVDEARKWLLSLGGR